MAHGPAATKQERPKLNPLMLLPGLVFWVVLAIGFATGEVMLIGLAVTIVLVTVTRKITIKLRASSAHHAERSRIWHGGTAATARVISIGTSGGGMNGHPMVDLELDVAVGGRPAYRASVQTLLSKLAIPRIQPDCEIAIRVDPHDPGKLVVDSALTPYGYRERTA